MKQLDVEVSTPAKDFRYDLQLAKSCRLATSPHILEWPGSLFIVAKFQVGRYYTFWDMNYSLVWILVESQTDRQTDGQTESDAHEPTVHKHRCAQ